MVRSPGQCRTLQVLRAFLPDSPCTLSGRGIVRIGTPMPTICLSHSSARELWGLLRKGSLSAMPSCAIDEVPDPCRLQRHVLDHLSQAEAIVGSLSRPLHVCSHSREALMRGKDVRGHLLSDETTDEQILRLGEGLYVTSPELTLAQLSLTLSPLQRAAYAMELMGAYSLDPDGHLSAVQPITTQAQLRHFYSQLRWPLVKGHMRRAVELAREGSRSPAETELYLLLCAPPRQGGYGLTKPELNIPFSLPTQWDALLNTPYILPDLCWPCKKLAMEYDSKRYHSLEQERDRDDDRRCALEELGFTVISLRTKRFMDPHRFDELVRHRVAPRLGVKPPPSDHEFWNAIYAARRELLSPAS